MPYEYCLSGAVTTGMLTMHSLTGIVKERLLEFRDNGWWQWSKSILAKICKNGSDVLRICTFGRIECSC